MQRERFVDFVKEPVDSAIEGRIGSQFRHQVVVVGVEPLGHFHGRLCCVAPREFVVLRQRKRRRLESEALRQRAEQRAQVQHLIVVSEVTNRDEVELRRTLQFPMPAAQFLRDALQIGSRRIRRARTIPVRT
jgi:hypothetical protein